MIPAGNCSLEAVVSVHLYRRSLIRAQSVEACTLFRQNAAYTIRTLSLQGVLLCQAVLCQPETENLLIAAAFVGHQCRCRSAQVGSV